MTEPGAVVGKSDGILPGSLSPGEQLRITVEFRLSAYALCIRDGRILLARFVGPAQEWTLPGGGIEHGEDPYDAVLREAEEETGYRVEVDELLGIHTKHRLFPDGTGAAEDFHGVRVLYTAHVIGGELRPEVGGTTDWAEWIELDRLGELRCVDLVDVALRMHRSRPLTGRLIDG